MRIGKYESDILSLKDTHSYSAIVDYLLEKYGILTSETSISKWMKRNGYDKPLIRCKNQSKCHGQAREDAVLKGTGFIHYCGSSRRLKYRIGRAISKTKH